MFKIDFTINPRKRFDIVKDPIHGYIRFTRNKLSSTERFTEVDLINSEWLQRLRKIHQLQTAWYVYPAADHTRFIHALGVMELAGRFVRMVYEPFYKSLEGKIDGDPLPEIEYVVETFRLAGLLHDVGHGPLTHLLDRKFLKSKYDITHEDISKQIIKEELGELIKGIYRSPDGLFEEQLDLDIICNLIKKGGEQDLDYIWKPLHQIIRGAYDADKMDFLLRDGMLCGEIGITRADIDRLMFTSLLHKDSNTFQLHYSSIPLLISLIRCRQRMMEIVYYHRTVRAMELMIEDMMVHIFEELIPENPLHNLEGYKKVDEFALFQHIENKRESNKDSDRAYTDIWNSVYKRDINYKLLEESQKQIYDPREMFSSLNADELARRIEQETALENYHDFIIDSPPVETPGNIFSFSEGLTTQDRLMIYYEDRQSEASKLDSLAMKYQIPIKAIQYRLYILQHVGVEKAQEAGDSFRKHTGEKGSYFSSSESSF